MGLVYPAWCYDMVNVLAKAWANDGPEGLQGRERLHRGATRWTASRATSTSPRAPVPVYPDVVTDPRQGVTHYFYQVQNGRHTVISPTDAAESAYQPAPWAK